MLPIIPGPKPAAGGTLTGVDQHRARIGRRARGARPRTQGRGLDPSDGLDGEPRDRTAGLAGDDHAGDATRSPSVPQDGGAPRCSRWSEIRKAHRVLGSPVLELRLAPTATSRLVGFYFVRPPTSSRASRRLPGRSRSAPRRKKAVLTLRAANTVKLDDVRTWVRAIRRAMAARGGAGLGAGRVDRDEPATAGRVVRDGPRGLGEQRVVAALADAVAGVDLRAPLANQDRAGREPSGPRRPSPRAAWPWSHGRCASSRRPSCVPWSERVAGGYSALGGGLGASASAGLRRRRLGRASSFFDAAAARAFGQRDVGDLDQRVQLAVALASWRSRSWAGT